ncbi:MAG: hypothetical protein BWY04_01071 [candidate division CPR1 bacterium ADurb.Bin160]|mgnify:CR=1 FL=1|uniref:Uncharacterized protein n=1 Tax=candidate division CPR1 bacterium ADurb.Bin160 TaxID=1852826 RepID=A0A1V5ZLP1_9BACT|nr:MAG: hypothetical protein BWY04_01071 [candidate division CPR1 bacterium ADurb.Bin160]
MKTKNILENFIRVFNEETEKVRIPFEKGSLGLSLDDSIEKYKEKIESKESTWEEMSKQLNTLVIFNKRKHPDVAQKARNLRKKIAAWIEEKREKDQEFGKLFSITNK